MRKVAIVGAGTTSFKSRWIEKTYFELAFDAVKDALTHAKLSREDIQCCVYGVYNDIFQRQIQPDLYIHDYIGMAPRPAVRVATGGATGGSAVRIAFSEIASGMYDIALVLGVEKCSDCYNYELQSSTPEILKTIRYTADATYEGPTGRTAAGTFALSVIAHREKYGTPTELQMAKVSVKNHRNALKNPIAQSPKEITVEDVLSSRMVCYPFKFYDNCLYSEGASALILASEEKAKEITDKPVWITGVGASLDWSIPGNRPNIIEFTSSRIAAKKAYEMAGISNPLKEIDLAELHDAFTGLEILAYEDCGFCNEGEGGRLIDEGTVDIGGALPVNVSGGLIGCGHAIGASGVMQTREIVLQLKGEAGDRQIRNARRGMIQSVGGTACAWTVVLILERRD